MTLLPPPPILFSIFLAGFTLLFNGIGEILQGMGVKVFQDGLELLLLVLE